MRRKILWITETAAMLALLIVLQWATKPAGQLVTGTCVNGVLAISVLIGGMGNGVTVALLSPVMAYGLGIAPNLATVPAIMVGNTLFVTVLKTLTGRQIWKKVLAWASAAVLKFAVLYALVNWIICGVAADVLLAGGILKAPMVKTLPAAFSWPQLVTALLGGAVALAIVPALEKALPRR